ncbi:hypothetical protein L5515_001167 [Caenorhabditis briggsae]|uniref:A to I editase domain-containing protein n=1 Tax=Caenorhabditis briggsae TaxID=6238 RepID=A0AAE9E0H7_CAEBR|nr:hypothetical protein L5515_001167 [Caenorhabditis briggsae]
MVTNAESLEPVNLEDDVFNPRECTAKEIDQCAIQLYSKKCEQYHEDPKAFAAFLLNINGELSVVSFASSSNENTDRKKLTKPKNKDQLMHVNPLILARRGLLRYFISEIKKLEAGSSDVMERNDEGEIQMKATCQLYMYSTFSYVCEYVYWGTEAMKEHDTNHCLMNKIRRWVALGVQGALLSNILNPVYITKFVIGSQPPLQIYDIWAVLFSKLEFQDRECPPMEMIPNPENSIIKTSGYSELEKSAHPSLLVSGDKKTMRKMRKHIRKNFAVCIDEPQLLAILRASPPLTQEHTFFWVAHLNRMDFIGKNGKLESETTAASICKQEIFKAYLQLDAANKKILKYSRAKKAAGHYQALKKMLYKQWELEKNGKWLNRSSNKVDKFWIELKKN